MAQSAVFVPALDFPIRAPVIKQLQARVVRESEVGNLEIAAVDRLKLFESENTLIEIQRFLEVDAIDGDVVNASDIQFFDSKDDKLQPILLNGLQSMLGLENFPFGDFGRYKDLEEVRIATKFVQGPFQIFEWNLHGEQRFRIDPTIGK